MQTFAQCMLTLIREQYLFCNWFGTDGLPIVEHNRCVTDFAMAQTIEPSLPSCPAFDLDGFGT